MLNKKELRKELRSRLEKVSAKELTSFEELANKHLSQLIQEILSINSNKRIALLSYYSTFKGEIRILPLINQKSQEIVPFFPQVTCSKMIFLKSENQFSKGLYGIYAPEQGEIFQAENFDLAIIIIPGLGFDRLGNRLGRGKGYYDRFLGNLAPTLPLIKIGVGLSCQLVSSLPIESHDQKIDFLILETGLIKPSKLL